MMKKQVLLLLVLCLLPMSVFAKTQTKEDLLKTIEKIENVQVDDDIKILSTSVEKKSIYFMMEENERKSKQEISYIFKGNTFVFTSGTISYQLDDLQNIQVEDPSNNQYAFYLYSILESMSTAPYEEENYYNNKEIKKKIESLTTEELLNYQNSEKELYYQNTGKTFGLTIKREKNNNTIYYHYYLDGLDPILTPIEATETFTNPNTGNFSFFITVLLLIVVALAGYTYWDNPKEKRKV